jgi:hypothetical protein
MEARYAQRTRNRRRRSTPAEEVPVQDRRKSARAALDRRVDVLVATIERLHAR